MVLHFNGNQWIAVDRSEAGIYVDGVRMSTVFIHDGRAITLGDPSTGRGWSSNSPPRLLRHRPRGVAPADASPRTAPPPHGPVPTRASRPATAAPATYPYQAAVPHFQPPAPPATAAAAGTTPAPPPRGRSPPPTAPPAAAAGSAASADRLCRRLRPSGMPTARITGAMQKLKPGRPQPRPHEAAPTGSYRAERHTDEAPKPTTIAGPLEARRVRLSVDGEQALADLSFTASPGRSPRWSAFPKRGPPPWSTCWPARCNRVWAKSTSTATTSQPMTSARTSEWCRVTICCARN